jgi:glutaminyl-peptide cyclotransferase
VNKKMKKIKFALFFAFAAVVPLLSSGLTGCGNDTRAAARNISPRDAAIEKAEAWEKKRYADIQKQKEIPVYGYRVLNEFDHDETSFTEGLIVDDGVFYESAGLWDQSRLVAVDMRTGVVQRRHDLVPLYFAEGITVLGDEIFQLTYQSCIGFVFQKDDFELKRTFHFQHQGWGLTDDGNQLIMSNGSAALIFVDPETMAATRYVVVTDPVGPVGNLNELEYINGEVYANIFKTALIVRINPDSGAVTGWIDMSGINPDPAVLKDPFVLNGIAHDEETGHIFVTGKCWPKIYEIELIPPE